MVDNLLSVSTVTTQSPPTLVCPQPQRPESKYLFTKEISCLAFGFGDEPNPNQDTVHLLECYMIEYVRDLLSKASNRAQRRGGKLELNDIMHYLRDHPKQYNRVKMIMKHKKATETTSKLWEEEEPGKKKKKL
ncbi:unnamed protein product [Blepharisma stoltei]|uniref:Transcription initiation factor TFIID subunit 13 n=1 Tax=Blepharisma stoltei TaxID=1481888 RepID=A0AAU9IJJ9_9CILI|nr:unnamed protein product [Blepharisma stoltei]